MTKSKALVNKNLVYTLRTNPRQLKQRRLVTFLLTRRRSALARRLLCVLVFVWSVVPYQRCVAFGSVMPAHSAASAMQSNDCSKMSRGAERYVAPPTAMSCNCVTVAAASAPTPSTTLGISFDRDHNAAILVDYETRFIAFSYEEQVPPHRDYSNIPLFLPLDRQVVLLN